MNDINGMGRNRTGLLYTGSEVTFQLRNGRGLNNTECYVKLVKWTDGCNNYFMAPLATVFTYRHLDLYLIRVRGRVIAILRLIFYPTR